jgi:mannose-6-phosphate isomerase-like protein (cupin superfamily)
MLKKIIVTGILLLLSATFLYAQTPKIVGSLDGRGYTAKDPDIDMYMGNWKESWPKRIHGSLIVREILTRCEGDPINPSYRGAVLTSAKLFAYTTLIRNNVTTPAALKGEQEIFYVVSGKGAVTMSGKIYDLHPGMAFLIPENLEFALKGGENEHLNMYLVVEPTPPGFTPARNIVIHDEAQIKASAVPGNWVYIKKNLFNSQEGLASLQSVFLANMEPNTFGQPHSNSAGEEEVWSALDGDIKFLLGRDVREFPIGTAYKVPPDGAMYQANMNFSDKKVKLFGFTNMK